MKALLYKEYLLAVRNLHDLMQPLFFILILVVLFPMAIGIDENLLQKVSSGIIWIAILLSVLLASEKFFKADFEDGSLEQLYLSGESLLAFVFVKALVTWLVQILPILLALPLFGLFYNMSLPLEIQLALTIIVGSPSLLLFAMLGSAVTLLVARSGMLLMLLILPFYIPTLVFALSAISAFNEGFTNFGQFAILGAIFISALIVVPFAIVATIKVSLSNC